MRECGIVPHQFRFTWGASVMAKAKPKKKGGRKGGGGGTGGGGG
jgi:hypothetical protein